MTPGTGSGGVPPLALALFLAYLAVERIAELRLSARHARALRPRGAVEYGRSHFPWFVALHTLFPLALVAEVAWGNIRPGRLWPLWLGLFAAAQLLRFVSIRALGEYWNARVWVVPGMKPIRRGPYRYLSHPNYVAVVCELFSAPMMFGAWRTAVVVSILNLILLRNRIRVENRALEEARTQPHGSPHRGVSARPHPDAQ